MGTHILIEWLAIFMLFMNCGTDAISLDIKDGTILGGTDRTVGKNKTYYYFRGIPYAEPPIEDLRFETPVAKKPWKEVIDCTEDRSQCVQGNNPVTGSEDCLFTNVYTTSLTGSSPVLIYIHGGAFIFSNSSYRTNGPDYFLEENLVFVSFNYRLGIFGFISTEDLSCPGNVGLKDQRMALAWVQENIAFFGGDPQNVTIFGESAGSVSVSYHVQSNQSSGLFHRAIMDSGTSLSLWALNRRSRTTAFAIGLALSIVTTDSKVLIRELKRINSTSLQSKADEISSLNALAGLQFGPVKEPIHEGAFFTEESDDMLSRGEFNRVPCLMGVNSNEAAIVGEVTAVLRWYVDQYDINTSNLAPIDLTEDVIQRNTAANVIKCAYFNCSMTTTSSVNIVEFISDDQFNRPTRRAVLNLSRFVSVYYYVFSYEGMLGGVQNRTLPGVGHTEELGYLFRQYYKEVSKNDILMRRRMVRMWSNFARFGNPTPAVDALLQNETWQPVISDHLYYLNIDSNIEVLEEPFKNRMNFYDNIYGIYGTSPYDTY